MYRTNMARNWRHGLSNNQKGHISWLICTAEIHLLFLKPLLTWFICHSIHSQPSSDTTWEPFYTRHSVKSSAEFAKKIFKFVPKSSYRDSTHFIPLCLLFCYSYCLTKWLLALFGSSKVAFFSWKLNRIQLCFCHLPVANHTHLR